MSKLSRTLWLGLLLLPAFGCGRGADKLEPVEGQVFYKGKPLAGGTIVFAPDPERGGHGPLAFAEIQPDGRFTLRTGETAGAVVGWHRVTVASASPTAAVPGLPAKYCDPERSGQRCEVKPGQPNTIEIRLD
jgi:hypothetical protein